MDISLSVDTGRDTAFQRNFDTPGHFVDFRTSDRALT
jgi:hypothetical protein